MDTTQHNPEAPVCQAFIDLPAEAYKPEAEKIRNALTYLYETRLLFCIAGDYVESPNPDKEAEELAHFTYEELYRGTAFEALPPLMGTVEENADSLRSWVRRALKNNAIDLVRRRKGHRKYVKAECQRQSHGARWAKAGSPNETKRASDPLQAYFARESRGGNDPYAKALVAELRLRWPKSVAVLMQVYGYGEPMTEVAKHHKAAPRTIRDRVERTRQAMKAYGEWVWEHGEREKDNPLVAAVDAVERVWEKSARR